MVKKLFPKYPPFINRINESKYLNDYLKDAPSSILFVYGPKSTGKTTLINKVINELIKKTVDLDIWFFDARKQRLTANSQTTRKAFERF